jgi:hypothetical protein
LREGAGLESAIVQVYSTDIGARRGTHWALENDYLIGVVRVGPEAGDIHLEIGTGSKHEPFGPVQLVCAVAGVATRTVYEWARLKYSLIRIEPKNLTAEPGI